MLGVYGFTDNKAKNARSPVAEKSRVISWNRWQFLSYRVLNGISTMENRILGRISWKENA